MFGETVIGDTILGLVLGEGFTWSKEKIKKAVNGNEYNDTISLMYKAVVDSLNKMCGGEKEDHSEKIYDAAEKIFNHWKADGGLRDSTPKEGLNILFGQVDAVACGMFIDYLEKEIVDNEILCRWYSLQINKHQTNTLAKIENAVESSKKNNGFDNFEITTISHGVKIFQNNRKQEFIEKWNARLFLHTGENDKNLTLANTFIMPSYTYTLRNGEYNDLENILDEFFYDKRRTMVIFGKPGMGKSSILAFLAQKYQKKHNIIILKFKDIGKRIKNQQDSILQAICEELCCTENDLHGKLLMLDAFDELKYHGDCLKLLNNFLLDIRDIPLFKLLVTSRENYIDIDKIQFQITIILEPFNAWKITKFHRLVLDDTEFQIGSNELHRLIMKKNGFNISFDSREIIGIPVILYLALTVGIDLRCTINKSELYEKIFSLKGGIFDRFATLYLKGYDETSHTIEYIKEEFKQILCDVAFVMFQNHSETINLEQYLDIANKILNGFENRAILDFPIKNLYASDKNVEFVHKSIYEYFIAEYIFQEIKNEIKKHQEETLAEKLGILLGIEEIPNEIQHFLKWKFESGFKNEEWKFVTRVLNIMIERGMTYYLKNRGQNIIILEKNIFSNLLMLIHLRNFAPYEIIKIKETDILAYYLRLLCSLKIKKHIDLSYLSLSQINLSNLYLKSANLKKVHLKEANLKSMCLENANLRDAHLEGAHLEDADLKGVHLEEARLEDADLRGAHLEGARLEDAHLERAYLEGAHLEGAHLEGADLRGAHLEGAHLEGAHLEGTHLEMANLEGTTLSTIYLEKAHLSGTIFNTYSIKFIDTQDNPSLIDALVYVNGNTISYTEYRKKYR